MDLWLLPNVEVPYRYNSHCLVTAQTRYVTEYSVVYRQDIHVMIYQEETYRMRAVFVQMRSYYRDLLNMNTKQAR